MIQRSLMEQGMAKPRPGMGRGLDAILSVSAEGAVTRDEELRELPVDLIAPSPTQPRRRFDQEALQALAGSLGERGVLQPVLVRPRPGGTYELVAGERRWRAAQIAGLDRRSRRSCVLATTPKPWSWR